MSIVAFDGTTVFYDSVCVGASHAFAVDKVVVSKPLGMIACSVGVWGCAMRIIQTLFQKIAEDKPKSHAIFIEVDVLDDDNFNEYDGEVYIIDALNNRMWMFDKWAKGFCAVPLQKFVIGHERCSAIAITHLDAVNADKWIHLADELTVQRMNPRYPDVVTMSPYYVIPLASLEKVAV